MYLNNPDDLRILKDLLSSEDWKTFEDLDLQMVDLYGEISGTRLMYLCSYFQEYLLNYHITPEEMDILTRFIQLNNKILQIVKKYKK